MDVVVFLVLLTVGAFVQTIAGFAMALIVMGGVALLGVLELTTAAAVVSLVSLANVLVALRRQYKHIHRRLVVAILIGMFPGVFVGVVVLDILSSENFLALKIMLGFVIVLAGLLLMSKPEPYTEESKREVGIAAGVAAGLMSGLYGAGGAPIAYLMYRQPVLIQTVRASLLSVFAISTLFRTGIVAVEGHLTREVFQLVALSIPVVVIATLIGDRVAPLLPEQRVQKLAFLLLVLLGVSLLLSGFVELLL